MRLSTLFLSCFVFFWTTQNHAQIADALPGCLNLDQLVGVNCSGSTNVNFGINGLGQMEVNNINGSACCNIGGNHASFFTFEVMDISSYENISISMDYSAAVTDYETESAVPLFDCQNMGNIDNSHDQIQFAYILDGTEILDLYVTGTTAADFTGTWNIGGINGNTLQIKVYASNKAGAEAFYFENLVINGDPAPISAGPDESHCNGASFTVNGSASSMSTWSGGSGTFTDPGNPVTTYTSAPGDDNSTVALRITGVPTTPGCRLDYPPPFAEANHTFSAPTATFAYTDPSFDGHYCTDECATIDINITGGVPNYTLEWNISVGALSVPLPNFTVTSFSTQITICYDPDLPLLPAFNASTNTLSVPAIVNGASGNINLTNITDAVPCSTPLNESVTASFTTTPELDQAILDPQCPDANGEASFSLSDALAQLNAPAGSTVEFFQNNDMTGLITDDPYTVAFPGRTIYAFASIDDCVSDPEPINLIILPAGDVGDVEFYCNNDQTSCLEICDFQGDGELISLTIILEDPNSTYEVVVTGGPSGPETFILSGGTNVIEKFANGFTFFEIVSISRNGTCLDLTDLGEIVEVDLLVPPLFDDPGIQPSCDEIFLPMITGTNVPPGSVYYSEPGGMGMTFTPGTSFTMSDTLYLYGGVPGCDDEVEVIITIGEATIYDQPSDVSDCGSYVLPEIIGTNVGDSTSYYTMMNGNGTRYRPGDVLTSSVTLFIFDPTSSCQENQPSFMVELSGGTQIEALPDTQVCSFFILPAIEPAPDLSGDQAYYTEPNAGGTRYNIGDTLTQTVLGDTLPVLTTILYAFDSTTTCQTQQSFRLAIERQGNPGISDTIGLCQGSADLLNLPQVLGGEADTFGRWTATPAGIDLSDSTAVDVSNLGVGIYRFDYTLVADSLCSDTAAFVRLEINDGANAGSNTSLTTCADTDNINFEDLLQNEDPGGLWYSIPPLGIDFSDPSNVDISVATQLNFNVYYKIPAFESCAADSAEIRVILVPPVSAGSASTSNVCAGSDVDLATLLTNNTSVGRFEDASNNMVVSNIFSTAGLNGTFTFNHIVDNPVCASDTTQIIINVANAVSAGEDVSEEICNPDDLLNLLTLLSNADGGGSFFYGTTPIANEIIPSDFDVSQSFFYVVGDDVTCPIDKAEIQLSLVDFDLEIRSDDIPICVEAARFVRLIYTIDRDYIIYFSTTNLGTGNVTYFDRTITEGIMDTLGFQVRNRLTPEGGTNLNPGQSYLIQIDSIVSISGDGCILFPDESFNVNTEVDLSVNVDTTICRGESILVDGQLYTESFMGTEMSPIGCIKEIDINIDYFPSDTSDFTMTVCDGSSVTIGNQTFTPQAPSGFATIDGGSFTGCDSTVRVDITFDMPSAILVDDIICGNQTIEIGGEIYDANNLNGMYTAPGQGEECDTVYTIALQLGTETIINVNDLICDDEEVMVAGEVYNAARATGEERVMGFAGACDTIFRVDLEVGSTTEGFETIYACDPTEVFTVGNLTLDINNPSGTYLFGMNRSGCDSLVNVEVTYDQLLVDITYIEPLCEEDIAEVVINNVVSQNPPVMMEINGEMVTLTSFPTPIALAGLDLDLRIFDSQGCSFEQDTTFGIFPIDINVQSSIVQNGEQLTVVSNVAPDQVIWSPAEGLSCSNCDNPLATPEVTTTYTVEVVYGSGFCSETLQVTVRVEENNTINLPNMLSLGGNPDNANFYIKTDPDLAYQINTMLIYDRWGNKVFSLNTAPTNDPSLGWNGRYKGSVVSLGVYSYYVSLSSEIEGVPDRELVGDITVIR